MRNLNEDTITQAVLARHAEMPMFDLAASLGAPTALKDIGMPEGQLDWCAEIATQNAYANPRPIEKAAIRALLEDAYHGKRP